MKKRLCAMALALCLCVSCWSMNVAAANIIASGKDVDQAWSLDSDGIFRYTGTGSMPIYPSPTRVHWRKYAHDIKTVYIGEGITHIGDFCFVECQNLSVVIIPQSVVSVSPYAFGDYPPPKDVYYAGNENQWNKIKFTNSYTSTNAILNARIHYNSTGPAFLDVSEDAYYAKPVAWAVEHGITSGTSATTFSPDAPCTRGQIVTFLWNAAGKPEPSSAYNPFADVKASKYFYKPVLWAVENNITSGTDASHFSPNAPCTRSQAVTFLWRAKGQPYGANSSFRDVPGKSFYKAAVDWAVENGITSGTSATTFGPGEVCTRGQIVTFLYRASDVPDATPEEKERTKMIGLYKIILSNLYYNHTMPDSSYVLHEPILGDISDNQFAVADVDCDGKDELIVQLISVSMAGQHAWIIGFDGKNVFTEYSYTPYFTAYDNGLIRVLANHDQSLGTGIVGYWPYSFRAYNHSNDTYNEGTGYLFAWNKKLHPKDYNGREFPDYLDKDGNGALYLIPGRDEYVDDAEYREWEQSYLQGAEELNITYQKLTPENIVAIK